jgi:hypothetical protein
MLYEFIQVDGVWKLYWGGYFGQGPESALNAERLDEVEEVGALTPATSLAVEDEDYVPVLSA